MDMDKVIEEILKELKTPQENVDEPTLKKVLYHEMVRLSLLIDSQATPRQISSKMAALVRKIKPQITAETDSEKIDQLLQLFYHELGFSCHYADYFNTDVLKLHNVLETKRGMPISLATILLYLATNLSLPIYAVNFPTQLVLRVELQHPNGRKETRFINPWDGKYLAMSDLEKWLEGEIGLEAILTPELIRRATPTELTERVETLFKMALTKEHKYQEVLDMIEFRLIFSPEDPYEIRDRGMILASLNCYQAAIDDLSYFIDQCPDDPTAVMLKNEIKGLEKKSKENLIH